MEGATVLGTVDFSVVPRVHTSTQQPSCWLALLYIACSRPWSENITQKSPEANLGFTCHSKGQDDISWLGRELSSVQGNLSVPTTHPCQQQATVALSPMPVMAFCACVPVNLILFKNGKVLVVDT